MLGKIDLLSGIFEEVFVPEAVYREIVFSDSINEHGKTELKKMIDDGEILLRKVENSNLVHKLYESFTKENLK